MAKEAGNISYGPCLRWRQLRNDKIKHFETLSASNCVSWINRQRIDCPSLKRIAGNVLWLYKQLSLWRLHLPVHQGTTSGKCKPHVDTVTPAHMFGFLLCTNPITLLFMAERRPYRRATNVNHVAPLVPRNVIRFFTVTTSHLRVLYWLFINGGFAIEPWWTLDTPVARQRALSKLTLY